MTMFQTTQSKPKKIDRSQIIGLMDDDFERIENRPAQSMPVQEHREQPKLQTEGTIYFNKSSSPDWETTSTPVPDIFQREFANYNLNPSADSSPKVDILEQAGQIAEAAFGSIGSIGKVTEGTGEAVADLWKNIFGVGEYKSSPPGSKEQSNSGQEKTISIEAIQNWFAEISRNQTLVDHNRRLDESLRLVGREVTKEDAEAAGLSTSKEDLLKSATLHIVADTQEENIEQYKEQEQTKEDQKMQQFTGENALLMGGERSGGGHWSTTPG